MHRPAMRHALRLALPATLAAMLALSACAGRGDEGDDRGYWDQQQGKVRRGTGAQEAAAGAASAHVAMPERGPIPAGKYVTEEFEPDFSFEVGSGWEALAPEQFDALGLGITPKGGLVCFTNPRLVFDPSEPSAEKEVPAPGNAEGWVSWFERHPNLQTEGLAPVRMGDASGVRIDVRVSSAPRGYPRGCPRPCVPLYPTSAGPIDAVVGTKDRFIVVELGDETVVVDVGAPEAKFEEFIRRAQKELNSVEWTGS